MKIFNMIKPVSCYGRNHSQTIFAREIPIKILAASSCMTDFFCENIASSNFCDNRKSALTLTLNVNFFFFLFKDVEKKNGAKEPQTPHP